MPHVGFWIQLFQAHKEVGIEACGSHQPIAEGVNRLDIMIECPVPNILLGLERR